MVQMYETKLYLSCIEDDIFAVWEDADRPSGQVVWSPKKLHSYVGQARVWHERGTEYRTLRTGQRSFEGRSLFGTVGVDVNLRAQCKAKSKFPLVIVVMTNIAQMTFIFCTLNNPAV